MRETVSGRRGRIVAVLAALLVPVAVLGVIQWSLDEPAERIRTAKAAVVNNDKPVEVDGRPAPLGRQLTAKLVGEEIRDNYQWEIATEETAARGMRDGDYVATVVIPEGFSQAATSYARKPADAKRARIDVTTSDRGTLVDEAVSRQVAASAATLLGRDLSARYLDNVLLGFTKLNKQLGKASDGLGSLAGGARRLAGGTEQLSGAAGQLAGGNRKLADGIGGLEDGTGRLATGASELASGVDRLRDSAAAIPGQVDKLAGGAELQAKGTTEFATGLGKFSDGMRLLAENCPPASPLASARDRFSAPTALQYCDAVRAQAAAAEKLDAGAGKLVRGSDGVATGVRALNGETPSSAGGLPALVGGIDRLAGGAETLASGVQRLHDGTSRTRAGADTLADGAQGLAGGTGELGQGAAKLGDGTGRLSGGLDQAARSLPSYDDGERDALSTVVSDPVEASAGSGFGLGAGAAALYAVLALWLGGLATFLVLRPVPRRALESTRSSALLVLRGVRAPLLVALAQGVLVTVLLGTTRELSVSGWFACAGFTTLVAVACTALNQALAAVWPVVGRFAATVVALLLLATGFSATVPALLTEVTALLPVGPAVTGVRALLDGAVVAGGTITALVVWALVGLAVSYAAVERSRTVRTADLVGTGRRVLRPA